MNAIDYLFEIKNKIVNGENVSISEEELKCLIVLMDKVIHRNMDKISSLEKENLLFLKEIFFLTKDDYICYKCPIFDKEKISFSCLSCVKNRVMYKDR